MQRLSGSGGAALRKKPDDGVAMPTSIAPLIGADEYLIHQIPNTLATVHTADHSWAEKIWATLIRKDAGLQVNFGLGKYTNRSLIDGFAGVFRGVEQRTIR